MDGRIENTSKQHKMADISEEFLSENEFKAVLATFCCSDCGLNVLVIVEKIARDQRGYHKYSLCVIVCCREEKYHQKQ